MALMGTIYLYSKKRWNYSRFFVGRNDKLLWVWKAKVLEWQKCHHQNESKAVFFFLSNIVDKRWKKRKVLFFLHLVQGCHGWDRSNGLLCSLLNGLCQFPIQSQVDLQRKQKHKKILIVFLILLSYCEVVTLFKVQIYELGISCV